MRDKWRDYWKKKHNWDDNAEFEKYKSYFWDRKNKGCFHRQYFDWEEGIWRLLLSLTKFQIIEFKAYITKQKNYYLRRKDIITSVVFAVIIGIEIGMVLALFPNAGIAGDIFIVFFAILLIFFLDKVSCGHLTKPYFYEDVLEVIEKYIALDYSNLTTRQIADLIMRKILETEKVPKEEIDRLQDREYSKSTLNLNLPALVAEGELFDHNKYYDTPVEIWDKKYYLCSQWSDLPGDNDRSYLEKWIKDTDIAYF